MKTFATLLLAGAIAFSSAVSLVGQDAAAPMRRSSPAPESATPSLTPTDTPRAVPPPTPRPTATPLPAASSQTPSPAAAVSGPRKRDILDEKPVRAVEPIKPFPQRSLTSPAPTPAKINAGVERSQEPPSKKPLFPFFQRAPAPRNDGPRAIEPTFDLSQDSSRTTTATIRSLEKNWQLSIKEHDIGAVQTLLADDFEGTSSTGRKGRKAKLLSELGKDKNVYSSARVRGMKVRSLEPNVAVVTGIASETGTTPEGKRFKSARRFIDKWEYRDGRWQCVASEVERLPQE